MNNEHTEGEIGYVRKSDGSIKLHEVSIVQPHIASGIRSNAFQETERYLHNHLRGQIQTMHRTVLRNTSDGDRMMESVTEWTRLNLVASYAVPAGTMLVTSDMEKLIDAAMQQYGNAISYADAAEAAYSLALYAERPFVSVMRNFSLPAASQNERTWSPTIRRAGRKAHRKGLKKKGRL